MEGFSSDFIIFTRKTMEIRKATIQDLPKILDLQKHAFYSEALLYNDFTISPLLQNIKELEQEFYDKYILVGCIDGEIVASIRFYAKNNLGFIGKLIVAPEHQNKGLGRKLMLMAEQQLTTITEIELFTGEKSEKNIHLYQSLGYQITDIIPETGNVNLVKMKKKISAT